jgi:hypothetical protein
MTNQQSDIHSRLRQLDVEYRALHREVADHLSSGRTDWRVVRLLTGKMRELSSDAASAQARLLTAGTSEIRLD